MKYTYDSRIRFSECDETRTLTMAGLVNYLQDTATFQGEDVGMGFDHLSEMGVVWMITFWQIDILRMPKIDEQIRITTWSHGFDVFYGLRNFTVTSRSQELLAKVNSVWVLMDRKAGRPARVTDSMGAAYGEDPQLDMEYTPRKIRMPKGEGVQQEAGKPFFVEKHHLDSNMHVNNCQYIAMALEQLPDELCYQRMRAEYRMQARLGDGIVPVIARKDGKVTVSLNSPSGKPYALVEFS